jgi:hypothetical protein
MHSSISSSDHASRQTTIWLRRLLVALLLVAGMIEAATRIAFSRSSRIQSRIHSDYVGAKQIRPAASGRAPTLLLVGNSLLLRDVDMQALRTQVEPVFAPARYAIDNTQYLDWYFGLQRLLREGTHPDRLAVALSRNQLISRAIDGEYFGHYLMSGRNVIDVASDAGLDSTEASNLLFANWSAWFGSKSEIRKWAAEHLLPDTAPLAKVFRPSPPHNTPLRNFRDLIAQRLADLRKMGDANGVEFGLILMPDPTASDDDSATVLDAGEHVRLPVLVPAAMQELPLSLYLDGFHLSPEGAVVFTRDLARSLRDWSSTEAAQK